MSEYELNQVITNPGFDAHQKRMAKRELYARNHPKYLLAFGHITSNRKLYEKSLKTFPTDTLFEKEEYEKWLSKQDQIKKKEKKLVKV